MNMKINVPGKVLLLGGYAVLDNYPALSIGVLDEHNKGVIAEVNESPEFKLISEEFGINKIIKENDNKFEGTEKVTGTAFELTLKYISSKKKLKPVTIKLNNSPIFGSKDEKSGMGSSAASTVAVVAALFESQGMNIDSNRDEIHKIAQIAHSAATGKVGSGFDIACSSYGTMEYVRFPSSLINLSELTKETLVKSVDSKWEMKAKEVPFNYELLIFNVKSSSTSTTKAVKATNVLKEKDKEMYKSLIKMQADGEKIAFDGFYSNKVDKVKEGISKAREAQRKFSIEVSKYVEDFIPIEPKEFTPFMDEVVEKGYALAARCPGAGGYDSIVFVSKDTKTIDKIIELSKKYNLNIEYLPCKISKKGAHLI